MPVAFFVFNTFFPVPFGNFLYEIPQGPGKRGKAFFFGKLCPQDQHEMQGKLAVFLFGRPADERVHALGAEQFFNQGVCPVLVIRLVGVVIAFYLLKKHKIEQLAKSNSVLAHPFPPRLLQHKALKQGLAFIIVHIRPGPGPGKAAQHNVLNAVVVLYLKGVVFVRFYGFAEGRKKSLRPVRGKAEDSFQGVFRIPLYLRENGPVIRVIQAEAVGLGVPRRLRANGPDKHLFFVACLGHQGDAGRRRLFVHRAPVYQLGDHI